MKQKEKLKTVRNYADETGITAQWVYKKIKEGKLKSVEIDGVKFVVVK